MQRERKRALGLKNTKSAYASLQSLQYILYRNGNKLHKNKNPRVKIEERRWVAAVDTKDCIYMQRERNRERVCVCLKKEGQRSCILRLVGVGWLLMAYGATEN